nr:hypothetical protein [uncultured Flavobacterium sp.]
MTKQIKTQAKKPRFVVQTENEILNPATMALAQDEILKFKELNVKRIVFVDHKTKLKITYELDRKNYRVKQELYTPEETIESAATDSDAGANGDSV